MLQPSFKVRELPDGQLPSRPAALRPFVDVEQTFEEEIVPRLIAGNTVALGGLSLVGERGYMVATVGIMALGSKTPDGFNLKGWSLHLGHPEEEYNLLRYFDTEEETDDVLLPLPNTIVYFGCEADPKMTDKNTSQQDLTEIVHFILAFCSDDGAPDGIDW